MSVYAPDELLRAAADGLRAGNLAWTESLCRMVLEQHADDSAAREMIEQVRLLLRQQSAAAASNPSTTQERYLLIQAWGFGFWSDVDHVLGSILLAQITGRTPLVYWGGNSLFTADRSANAWEQFFEPVSSLTLDALERPGLSFFPPKWSALNLRAGAVNQNEGPGSRTGAIYLLDRPETVTVADFHVALYGLLPYVPPGHPFHGQDALAVYRTLACRYLRPTRAVLREVDEFHERHLAGSPFVAVHFRGSDKHREDKRIDQINAQYFEHVDRIAGEHAEWRVFLLTDSASAAAAFRERYGDRLVSADVERSSTDVGVHKTPGAVADGARRGREVLCDALLAARADHFIGNGGSNVSCMVLNLKQWDESQVTLLAPNGLMRHRPFLFRPR